MKRYLCLAGVIFGLSNSLLAGQDTPNDIAQRQEAEERYKRLSATVEDLVSANQTLQTRLSALREEVRSLREEVSRANDKNKDAAIQDNLKQLAKAIEEVDKKRRADNESVLAALAALEKKVIERAGSPVRPNTATPNPNSAPKQTEKGYEYTIRQNDNPHVIATALKQQGIKVTAQQIMDANPGVNWNKLRIGQKIFIPAPPP